MLLRRSVLATCAAAATASLMGPVPECSANVTFYNASAGACVACPVDCPIGAYRANCGGSSVGTCEACSDPPEHAHHTNNGLHGDADSCTEVCDKGYYHFSHTSNACEACADDCPVGEYRDGCGELSRGNCLACTSGSPNSFYTSNGEHGKPKSCGVACHAGYQLIGGACTPCPAGTFGNFLVPQSSAGYCTVCPHGQFTEVPGTVAACTPCGAGKRANVTVAHDTSEHCVPCAAGRFQDEVVFAEECKACAVGTFQSSTGSQQCHACKSSSHDECGAGSYLSDPCETPARTSDSLCTSIPVVAGVGGTVDYEENANPVFIAPAAEVTFASSLTSASVKLTHGTSQDDLWWSSVPLTTAITPAYDKLTDTLTLSSASPQSAAVFTEALRQVQFKTVGEMAGQTEVRSVGVAVSVCHTSDVCSDAQSAAIKIDPVNDPPTVDLHNPSKSAVFTVGTDAISLSKDIVLTDVDHTQLQSAVVRIAAPVRAGDTLSADIAGMAGISVEWKSDTAELKFSGNPSPLTQFQLALRTVKFHSVGEGQTAESSGTVSTAPREISFVIDDGYASSSSDALLSVIICAPVGYFSDSTTNKVAKCPAGKFQAMPCASACTSCAAGTHGAVAEPVTGAAHCKSCAEGQYQDAEAQTECVSCEAGTYGSGTGSAAGQETEAYCKDCATGRHQAVAGQAACIDCAAGTYADDIGQNECVACPCGTFGDSAGLPSCKACAAGTANAGTGRTTPCVACDAGSFASTSGSCSCSGWATCTAGFQNVGATTTAAGACAACPTGKFQAGTTSVAEPCSAWTTCASGAAITGMSATAAGTCDECAAGKYMAEGAHPHAPCTSCAAGKYGAAAGATSESACTACAAGHYASSPGTTLCTACGQEEYSATGAVQCTSCDMESWGSWSACSATCASGTKTRTGILQALHQNTHATAQCQTTETTSCQEQPCPHKRHCKHIKCRWSVSSTGATTMQVYHHKKEAAAVHHCHVKRSATGEKTCYCKCWDTMPLPEAP